MTPLAPLVGSWGLVTVPVPCAPCGTPPLVDQGQVFIQTTGGQYTVRYGAHVEFFATEHDDI